MRKFWKHFYPWLIGLVFLLALPVACIFADLGSVEAWLPVYGAGAVGGLILELSGGGWGIELPSSTGQVPKDEQFAPFGPWVDLGFLGRMITGAVAAPVFLIIVNVVPKAPASDQLAALGNNLDNIVWGVLIGAASPAAWKAGKSLVDARLAQVKLADAGDQADQADTAINKALKAQPKETVKAPLLEAAASVKAAKATLKPTKSHKVPK
jgi:hypothetical protein